MGREFIMVDDEETSLHRKYGYAIMALSVVVLAVLMVWIVTHGVTPKYNLNILAARQTPCELFLVFFMPLIK